MSLDDYIKKLAPELQEKVRACGSAEDLLALAKEEGIPLSDAALEAIAGGDDPNLENCVQLTCPKCGSEFQMGMYCENCGEELKWVTLFSGSTYVTCNPPTRSGFHVCKFSDEKLIYEFYTNEITERRYISAKVIDEAYRIIREHHIDEWEQYQNTFDGMMGGDVSVSYLDGDRLVGSSMSHMGFLVQAAYYALMELFRKNIL